MRVGDETEQRWSGADWEVLVSDDAVVVVDGERRRAFHGDALDELTLRWRITRWELETGDDRLRLRRVGLAGPRGLGSAIELVRVRRDLARAVEWSGRVQRTLDDARAELRWVTTEQVDDLVADPRLAGLRERAQSCGLIEDQEVDETDALDRLADDLGSTISKLNDEVLAEELVARRDFFDTIERSPLTEEQARAVACLDNRVRLIAAAGSGKTSVIVARAAYAVHRELVAPDRILILAFNKDAATELKQRMDSRFAAAGLNATGVRATTFHAFGLDVIFDATGKRPRAAGWLGDRSTEEQMVRTIVDDLCEASAEFRQRWDTLRLIFADDPDSKRANRADKHDKSSNSTRFATFGGDAVRSHGERMIANFLFLNHVPYEYERRYPHDTGPTDYRPDFYYPTIDTWHEHWGIGSDGRARSDMGDYENEMERKKGVHEANGTHLVQTTFHEVVFGDGLDRLRGDLTARGLELRWDPNRRVHDRGTRPDADGRLIKLFRTFMCHAKAGSLGPDDVSARLEGTGGAGARAGAGVRTRLFLDVYREVADEWQRRLDRDGSVDFEDMLVRAGDLLTKGKTDPGVDLVLVDELQDSSQARARIVQGLLSRPGRYLLAVGDDWQSINRFAGADMSVMARFADWFGEGPSLALTETFRCPPTIADVSSRFISQNSTQMQKGVRSQLPDYPQPVKVVFADEPDQALEEYLTNLSAGVKACRVKPGAGGTVSVDVLGRYRKDASVLRKARRPGLTVTFRTVHGAKGLEADFVILPCVGGGDWGFPSGFTDDPVLDLVTPEPEAFPDAEERRLFYVALTRARREVVVVAPNRSMSSFVRELIDDPDVIVEGGKASRPNECPLCSVGVQVPRKGPKSNFTGCSEYPTCLWKRW